MEKFGYGKLHKFQLYLFFGAAIAFLLIFLGIAVFIVWPNIGNPYISVKFSWWVPFLIIGLIFLAVVFLIGIIKANKFFVVLSEDVIHIGNLQVKWEYISQVERKKSKENVPSIILHTTAADRLEIPQGMNGFPYIRGYIEGHAKNAEISGSLPPLVADNEPTQVLVAVVHNWIKRGVPYAEGFESLKKIFGGNSANAFLGEAQRSVGNKVKADILLKQIRKWKAEGNDETQVLALLARQGYGALAGKIFLAEVDLK